MNPQTIKPESKTTNIPHHKIGAICYGLWGFWHFQVVAKMFEFASSHTKSCLETILKSRVKAGGSPKGFPSVMAERF